MAFEAEGEAVLTKQKLAHNWLRAEIMKGSLLPGERVVIDQVARSLRMSAISVR